MNILIPIGGKGERFKNKGYVDPKPLIKILDKEMIYYVLDNLKTSREDKVFIFYHDILDDYKFKNCIERKYPNVNLIPINFQTRGAAETIKTGLDIILNKFNILNERCMLMDCDTFYTDDVIDMYKKVEHNAVFYTKNFQQNPIFSYIKLDKDNTITDVKEKVKISHNANTGIYCFDKIEELLFYCNKVINNNVRFNNEFYTSCVISEMINEGKIFKGIELESKYIFNLGTPEQVNEYINNCFVFLFDLDGTMVLTDKIYLNVWNKLLQEFNIYVDKEFYDKYIYGNSDETVLRKLVPESVDYKKLSKNKDSLFSESIDLIEKVNGIDNFLKIIRKNGHKFSIVTNCNRIIAEKIISICNFEPDFIIVGNECSKPKPHPEPYLAGIHNYNTQNSKCIIFEDSYSGLASAGSVNPKCIVGLETKYSNQELINYGSNLTIKNYDNIKINDLLSYKNINLDTIKKNIYDSIQNVYDVTDIKIYDEKLKGGFISDVIQVDIILKNKKIQCVLKLENKNETFLSKMANELGLYEREYYFYESISRFVNIRVPSFFGLIKDEHLNSIGILMENEIANKNFIGVNLNEKEIDTSLKIIDNLARFHSKFWQEDSALRTSSKNLHKSFPQLRKHNDVMFQPKWSNFLKSKLDIFKNKWKNILSESDLQKTETIVNNFNEIQNRLSSGNLTLTHGDVKAPNMFFTPDFEPIFIDWQYIAIGKGVQDLVFFMIESYDIEKINLYMTIFKNYYYVKLKENNILNYSLEEYEQDFKDSICYFPFFVALWFGSLNKDELIDKNFPFFFIKKLYNFINKFI